MKRLGSLLLSFCLLSIMAVAEIASADCPTGQCGSSMLAYGPSVPESRATGGMISHSDFPESRVAGGSISYAGAEEENSEGFPVYGIDQYSQCRPGECYLYYELVGCTSDDFTCIDGTRRIWSYRPLYYPRDNRELLVNLNKKLCPDQKHCRWPYTTRERY